MAAIINLITSWQMHKILCLIMNADEVWMNIVNMIMKFIFEGRIINI